MARRPGQLIEDDKLKLQSQGLPPDCQDELNIIQARYEVDKEYTFKVKSTYSQSQKEVLENIAHLLDTTQNDGGKDISNYCLSALVTKTLQNYFSTQYCVQ